MSSNGRGLPRSLTPLLILLAEKFQNEPRRVGRVSPLRAARLPQNGSQTTDAPYLRKSFRETLQSQSRAARWTETFKTQQNI